MPGRSLAEWLDYIERIHPKSIQLGLERVAKVRDMLGRSSSAAFFTVAGTNGKGSTCAMLEAILIAAGYRVGLYTSPHLLRYNERVRLDGVPLSDARLCAAFETIERIGSEKAGIFRRGKPVVVADPDPPRSVLDHAGAVGADLWLIGRDFGYQKQGQQWMFWGRGVRRGGLAPPALRGERQLANASAVLAALDAMRARLPVGMQDVRNGLAHVDLPARFQVLPGRPTVVLDVAHNPQAAGVLAENLAGMGFYPETYAVFGMLRDKDIDGVCRALKDRISAWFAADLSVPRGASARALADALASVGAGGDVLCFKNPLEAYAAARKRANENDRIVVFGSFHTVADVMRGIEAARTDIRGARQGS